MIAVIVPSRGRPQAIVELIEAWKTTRRPTYAEMIVAVDLDDPMAGQYAHDAENYPRWVQFRLGERLRLGGTLNAVAASLGDRYDVIGFMGDDHRPRTPRWDIKVAYQCSKTPLSVVYGDDLFQGERLPTAVFMDAAIVRRLGWFVLPGQRHLFMDNLWKTIGHELGTLKYMPDVVIEHLHPAAGKGEWDAGYAECNSPEVWSADEVLYRDWLVTDMAADIAKIRRC